MIYSSPVILRGVGFISFVIQSDTKTPVFLRERIGTFLESVKSKMAELSDEEFKKHIESVRTLFQQKPLNLEEEADRHWSEIIKRQFKFNRSKLISDIASFDYSLFTTLCLFGVS